MAKSLAVSVQLTNVIHQKDLNTKVYRNLMRLLIKSIPQGRQFSSVNVKIRKEKLELKRKVSIITDLLPVNSVFHIWSVDFLRDF